MIKTPLSTVIGGVGMYTKNSLIIGGGKTELPFDPKSLFENGEIGTLLDATDLNIFTNSAGTIKAKTGDAVGLLLDLSSLNETKVYPETGHSNVAAGGTTPPLSVNSAANYKDTLCISATFASVSSGAYAVSRASAFTHPIKIGLFYKLHYEYALSRPLVGSESVRVYATGANGLSTITLNANSKSGEFVVSESFGLPSVSGENSLVVFPIQLLTELTIYLRIKGIYTIDGEYAVQLDSSKRPLLQNDIKFDGIDDALNIAFPNALSNCTIFTVKHGQQAQILEAQSVAQNHIINQDFKYYGIVNRALTSAERTGLTRFLNKLGAQ